MMTLWQLPLPGYVSATMHKGLYEVQPQRGQRINISYLKSAQRDVQAQEAYIKRKQCKLGNRLAEPCQLQSPSLLTDMTIFHVGTSQEHET